MKKEDKVTYYKAWNISGIRWELYKVKNGRIRYKMDEDDGKKWYGINMSLWDVRCRIEVMRNWKIKQITEEEMFLELL